MHPISASPALLVIDVITRQRIVPGLLRFIQKVPIYLTFTNRPRIVYLQFLHSEGNACTYRPTAARAVSFTYLPRCPTKFFTLTRFSDQSLNTSWTLEDRTQFRSPVAARLSRNPFSVCTGKANHWTSSPGSSRV